MGEGDGLALIDGGNCPDWCSKIDVIFSCSYWLDDKECGVAISRRPN